MASESTVNTGINGGNDEMDSSAPQSTNISKLSIASPDVKIASLSLTLSVDNLKFIPHKSAYEIDISDAVVISTNPQNKTIKIQLSTSKMKKINRELADDDIDDLLDEIEDQNEFIRNRDQQILALKLYIFVFIYMFVFVFFCLCFCCWILAHQQ